jgi:hypothetical protein
MNICKVKAISITGCSPQQPDPSKTKLSGKTLLGGDHADKLVPEVQMSLHKHCSQGSRWLFATLQRLLTYFQGKNTFNDVSSQKHAYRPQ